MSVIMLSSSLRAGPESFFESDTPYGAVSENTMRLGKLLIGAQGVVSDKEMEISGLWSAEQSDEYWSNEEERFRLAKAKLQRLGPSVYCGNDSMTLRIPGSRTPHFLIDRGIESPVSLSEMPASCGFSLKRARRDVSLGAPYQGCHVRQQGGHYILPLLLMGAPVQVSCPVIQPTLAPTTVAPVQDSIDSQQMFYPFPFGKPMSYPPYSHGRPGVRPIAPTVPPTATTPLQDPRPQFPLQDPRPQFPLQDPRPQFPLQDPRPQFPLQDPRQQMFPLPQDPRPQFPLPQDPRPQFPLPQDPRPQFPLPQDPRPQFPLPQDPRPQFPLPQDPRPQFPLPQDPGQKFPLPQDPRPQFPLPQDPRPQFPRPQDPRPQFPRPQDPRPQFPRPQDPRPQFPLPQDPRPQFPLPQDPRLPLPQDPRPKFPLPQDPGQKFPRPQDPGQKFPRPQDPGPQFPLPQDPRPQFPRPQDPRPKFPLRDPGQKFPLRDPGQKFPLQDPRPQFPLQDPQQMFYPSPFGKPMSYPPYSHGHPGVRPIAPTVPPTTTPLQDPRQQIFPFQDPRQQMYPMSMFDPDHFNSRGFPAPWHHQSRYPKFPSNMYNFETPATTTPSKTTAAQFDQFTGYPPPYPKFYGPPPFVPPRVPVPFMPQYH
ncbi:unnamed protein product [Leuciscus chuanchicus]